METELLMEIIMSIKPKYIKKIFTGEKTVEIRCRKMNILPNTKIWLYSTSPEKSIVGSAVVSKYVYDRREKIWEVYKAESAIDEDEFSYYTRKYKKVSAILLEDIQKLKQEIPLSTLQVKIEGFHPPQFYKKLQNSSRFIE